ncbi:DUF2911 domain-containing protein [Flavobacterium sp. NST-5]|uniref:DUF2911 domain-containing protein n=1 Tax=Flavobacterium ichthyis TaxID=2698827 RepID=A0ABW9Z8C7_9FLAO|nr:DUF2911 domain-containing protein [Flavobacterium ichthyis]NBL65136.1 DUF2911 domain-containing protein [Flavobacterium ichthyis]
MKKIIVAAGLLFFALGTNAQVKAPAPSPKAEIHQVVGLTDVQLEYSRPSAKGRIIFGDLVPFGKMWRTGANANSIITFSEDVSIGGKPVKKGSYAIFTVPKIDSWDVIFYSDTNNWGLPEEFSDAKVAARVTVKPETINRHIETFTIDFNNLENNSGVLQISWEKTVVPVKIDVNTEKTAIASIEATLNGPTANDLYSAAQYYYQASLDQAKALTWVNGAIEKASQNGKEAPFWYLRLKSLIQAKKGDKKGAIETAKMSLAAAEKANNADYVKMNKDSIAEWSKK